MTVFSLIGKNLEHGALSVIRAAAEVVKANLSYKELVYGWVERLPTNMRT